MYFKVTCCSFFCLSTLEALLCICDMMLNFCGHFVFRGSFQIGIIFAWRVSNGCSQGTILVQGYCVFRGSLQVFIHDFKQLNYCLDLLQCCGFHLLNVFNGRVLAFFGHYCFHWWNALWFWRDVGPSKNICSLSVLITAWTELLFVSQMRSLISEKLITFLGTDHV